MSRLEVQKKVEDPLQDEHREPGGCMAPVTAAGGCVAPMTVAGSVALQALQGQWGTRPHDEMEQGISYNVLLLMSVSRSHW